MDISGTKNSILIIISKLYPFYPEFLQNEVDAIETSYDKVYVFCCSARKKDKLSQKIGTKYKIFRRNDTQNVFLKYIKYTFFGLFSILKRKDYRNELFSYKTLKGKIAVLYSSGKIDREYAFIDKNLQQLQIQERDQVVIYSYWFTDTAAVAALLKENIRANVYAITRAHGVDLYENRNISGVIPFRKLCLENLDCVFPCSKSGEEYLIKKYPAYKNKIRYAYLGTKDNGLNPFKKGNGIFRIVTCSNIIPVKRLDLLIDALKKMDCSENADIEWVCIGGGTLLPKFQEKSKQLKYITVRFLGPTPNDQVFEFYKKESVNVFINTSSSEGLPVSIMEAQSMGIPVIATDVGGTREIVINELTGFLISEKTSAKEIYDKIIKIKKMDFNSYISMRYASRNNYLEKFNSGNNYLNFHNNIIDTIYK